MGHSAQGTGSTGINLVLAGPAEGSEPVVVARDPRGSARLHSFICRAARALGGNSLA